MPAIPPRTGPAAAKSGRGAGPGRRTFFVVLVLLVCIVIVDALVGERGVLALMRTRQQHAALAAEVERARATNARLREEARRLSEDPSAVEELARREFGLIKPGEKLFIIRDVPSPAYQ